MLNYNVNQLIESVKSRIPISNTESSGTDDDTIRRHLNEAMSEIILPFLLRVKEEYLVKTVPIPIVSSQSRYPIPTRAIGNKLRDLMFRDNSTNPNRIALARINREKLSELDGLATQSNASCFYMEGDHFVLVPTINATPSGTLEVSFFFRPGELVTSDYYRVITGVNLLAGTITVATTPTDWDTTLMYDIHGPNSGAEVKKWDLVASNVSGNIFTFTSSLNKSEYQDAVALGDYLVLANTSALPSIPNELQPVLIQAAVCKIAEARGDEMWQLHNQRLKDMMDGQLFLIDDRVEGKNQKVCGGALLRAGRYSGIRTSRNIS
jgi:hypothetical protein